MLKEKNFQTVYKGKKTQLVTLQNNKGTIVQITNYGAKIASILTQDRNGDVADIVLGYESIDEFIKGDPYFGAICGRYANRIANGKFTLDGKSYQLPVNNGPNSLHGGINGFHDQVWDVEGVSEREVNLGYVSEDGEEGYPGNLVVKLKYQLTDDNELKILYIATTDQPTIVNLTNHAFYNLAGEGSGDILSQELKINASHYTPCNDVQIPTGEFRSVEGTPFDFQSLHPIGARIDFNDEQLILGNGYDHNFVLNDFNKEIRLAATAIDPKSGRGMEVYTDTPGVQLYTGNWLDGSQKGKGHVYQKRSAFCLECQDFPDAPNQPNFPTVVLRPGKEYRQTTIHKFFVK